MRILKVFALGIAVLGLVSCKSSYEKILTGIDADKQYELAFQCLEQKKYLKASQLFETMSVSLAGTPREDTILFYWGVANYRFKDYATAESNFTNFLENFPRSPMVEDARYYRVQCLYHSTLRYELDQAPTYSALSAIGEYLTDYPLSDHLDECQNMLVDLGERLDKKAFENARIYYRMEDYLAARVALKNVLKEDSDNIYREEILYYTAMSSYKYAANSVPEKQKERYLSFIDDYYNFIGEYEMSIYRSELDAMYRRSQRALGKYDGVDEDIDKKEKDFEKERLLLLSNQ